MRPHEHILRLWSDRKGNFAIWSALAMVPLLGATALALDYSSLSHRKSELQNALDSAVLAIAREGQEITDKEAASIARSYLAANFAGDIRDVSVFRTTEKVTVRAAYPQKLIFGGILQRDDAPISASSTAMLAYRNYEVAFVLDTTGSMKGGKLSSLQTAVVGLVNTMAQQIDDPDRLKFAVVPFANFVNVGPQHGPSFDRKGKMVKRTGADWLDLKGKADIPQLELKKGVSRFEVFYKLGQVWKGCVETRYSGGKKGKPYDVSDLPPNKKDELSLFVPSFSIDEPDRGYANSYIISDVDPLDKSITADIKKLVKYGISPAALGLGGNDDDDDDDDDDRNPVAAGGGSGKGEINYVGEGGIPGGLGPNKDCLTQPIVPLTTDYNAIKAMVKKLEANGTTNIGEGVAWGMRVLSPGAPFSEGRQKATDLDKIMIVLTDGANVFGNNGTRLGSSYSSNGYLVDGRLGVNIASAAKTNQLMNEKTLAACENAKKDGMIIYTIRLEEPDKATGTLLQKCATSPAHFFDAPSRSQLDEVFEAIGRDIVRLRLAS